MPGRAAGAETRSGSPGETGAFSQGRGVTASRACFERAAAPSPAQPRAATGVAGSTLRVAATPLLAALVDGPRRTGAGALRLPARSSGGVGTRRRPRLTKGGLGTVEGPMWRSSAGRPSPGSRPHTAPPSGSPPRRPLPAGVPCPSVRLLSSPEGLLRSRSPRGRRPGPRRAARAARSSSGAVPSRDSRRSAPRSVRTFNAPARLPRPLLSPRPAGFDGVARSVGIRGPPDESLRLPRTTA